MKKIIQKLLSISMVVLLLSCGKDNIVYNDYFNLTDSSWSHTDSVLFKWTINDTAAVYNIDLQLRASSSYKWSNIFIFSDVFFPNSKARRDTFEFFLADTKGHWIGERSGLIVDYSFSLYKKIRFPLVGEYKFYIQQAMRDTVLNEILDVGIKITDSRLSTSFREGNLKQDYTYYKNTLRNIPFGLKFPINSFVSTTSETSLNYVEYDT
jgi:gliding motility-associated lipoprotein GldH